MKTYKKLFVENPVDLVDVGNDTIKVRVDPIGHDNDKDFKDVPSGVFKKNTTVSQMVSKLGSGEGAASKFFKGKKVNPAIANEPVSKLPIEKNNIELRTTNDTVEEYGQPLKQSFKRYKPVFKETYLDFSDPQDLYLNPEDKDKELFNVNVEGEIEEPEEQNEEDVYNDEFEGNQAIADHEEIENFHQLGESSKFQESLLQEGYTHYWGRKGLVDPSNYLEALKGIANLVGANESILAGPDGEGDPIIDQEKGIAFNGKGEDSHESFILPRNPSEIRNFEFTKTAYKPYDVVVTAALTILHHFCPSIEINSDGNPEEWEEGVKLASKVMRMPLENPILVEEYPY